MCMHPTFISHLKYQYSFFSWNTNISPLPQSTNENEGVPVFPLLQPVAMDELWGRDRTSACKKALCSCFSLCLITPRPSRPVSAHVDVQLPKKFHISSPLYNQQQPINNPQTQRLVMLYYDYIIAECLLNTYLYLETFHCAD